MFLENITSCACLTSFGLNSIVHWYTSFLFLSAETEPIIIF